MYVCVCVYLLLVLKYLSRFERFDDKTTAAGTGICVCLRVAAAAAVCGKYSVNCNKVEHAEVNGLLKNCLALKRLYRLC